jgi:hypothetical protein
MGAVMLMRNYPALPTDIQAEQAVLGAVLMNNAAFAPVAALIGAGDFSEPIHQATFAAAAEMIAAGTTCNAVTIRSRLADVALSEDLTLSGYLARLCAESSGWVDAADYALNVRQASIARRIVQTGYRIENDWSGVDRQAMLDEELAGLAEMQARARLSKPRDFGRVRFADLDIEENSSADDYLVEGLLSAGCMSVIAGHSQSGKSFLAIHAGMCVALGVDFFDRPVKKSLVVYQAGEGGRGVKKRLKAFRKHFGIAADTSVPFELLTDRIDLLRPDDTPALIAAIRRIQDDWPDVRLGMVVIDTFARATGGADENSARDMALIVGNVEVIQRETGAHVCIVHHLNAVGVKMRGSTALPAAVDQTLMVSKAETGLRSVRLDKQKDDESGGVFHFALHSVELARHPVTDYPVTSCVCLKVDEKEALRQQAEAKGLPVSDNEGALVRALLSAIKSKGQPVPSDVPAPSRISECVLWSDVLAAYASGNPMDDDVSELASADIEALKVAHKEKHKKRVQRAREGLQRAGILGVAAPYAWWTGKPVRGFAETLPKPVVEPSVEVGDVLF